MSTTRLTEYPENRVPDRGNQGRSTTVVNMNYLSAFLPSMITEFNTLADEINTDIDTIIATILLNNLPTLTAQTGKALVVNEELANDVGLSATRHLTGTVTGTANAIILTTGYGVSAAPVEGDTIRFKGDANNTGATTITIDNQTVQNLKTKRGTNLPADFIRDGFWTDAYYDGTDWICSRESETFTDNTTGSEIHWRKTDDGWLSLSENGLTTTGTLTHTFSQAFVESPSCVACADATNARIVTTRNTTTTTVDLRSFDDTGDGTVTPQFRLHAEGYWF